MSKWTHSQCEKCWNEANPRMKPLPADDVGEEVKCCFCGRTHRSGIFVRSDPEVTICKGEHDYDRE